MSIFKESFKPEISGSLAVRQRAMVERTPTNIQYLNSRNSWIRMSSSVNVEGTNALAKSYILQGGTLDSNGNLKSGVGKSGNAYSSMTPSGTPHRFGTKPMPGITGIDVRSKSAYGSLREVTINFQCWDIRQLEDLELLYMRPGYTVLIEWGWMPFLDNSGALKTNIDYIDIIDKTYTKEDLYKEIYDKSLKSGGNYEAMYGKIMNYGWSARPEGGYDCQTTIISLGEILESLKINYVPSTLGLDNQFKGFLNGKIKNGNPIPSNAKPNITEAYNKNILAGVFRELYYMAGNNGTEKYQEMYDDKSYYYYFVKKLEVTNTNIDKEKLIGENSNIQVYVSLGSLVNLLNNYVILKAGQDPKNTKNNPCYVKLTTKDRDDKSLLCLAHPLQISVNPTVCVINSSTWSQLTIETQVAGSTNPETGDVVIKFNSNINVNELLDNIIRNTIPVSKINTKSALIKYIKDTIQGPENNRYSTEQIIQNIKELSRVFIEKVNDPSYKIKLPNKSASFGLIFDATSEEGKRVNTSLVEFRKGRVFNYFYDLLYQTFAANLDDTSISDILTPEGVNIARTNPIVVAQQEANKVSEGAKQLTDAAKESTKYLSGLLPYFYNDKEYNKNGLGIIENIFINLQFLYTLSLDVNLESQDKKEKKEINAYDFIKTVLSQISSATGNINNFDIFIENDIARIIDINYTDPTNKNDVYNNAFTFEMQNTKSIVRSYQLESQIFPEQSTMIAIGAQVRGGALGSDVSTLTAFNKNIEDRVIPYKNTDSDPNPDNPEANIGQLTRTMSTLTSFFKDAEKVGLLGLWTSNEYDFDKITEYENALKDLIGFFISINGDDMKNRAIIPTKLSLNIDGIGGLIIGNIFRIPDEILPRGYKGDKAGAKIGYLITGLGHSLQDGDWITKITSQFIILDEPTGKKNFNYTQIKVYILPDSGGVTTTIPNISNSEVGSVAEDSQKYPVLVKNEGFKAAYDSTVQKYAKVIPSTPVANSLRATLNKQYIIEKDRELSSNGDITEDLKNAVLTFQSKLIGNKSAFSFITPTKPIVITAGNDTYHRTYNDNRNKTTHGRGLAIDIRTTEFTNSQIGSIMNLLRESGFVYVIYHGGSALHIHANIKTT
jgi:hypothetical protein